MAENPLLADPAFVFIFLGFGIPVLFGAIMNWLEDRRKK